MDVFIKICQVVIALGIANVWLLRANRPSPYRGGSATTLREEFAAYGLPSWALPVVGAAKLGCAALLLIGLAVPSVVMYGALGLAALMVGAVAMHVKISDPPMKSVPAAVLLVLCLFVAFAG